MDPKSVKPELAPTEASKDSASKQKFVVEPVAMDQDGLPKQFVRDVEEEPTGEAGVAKDSSLPIQALTHPISREELIKSFVMDLPSSAESSDEDISGFTRVPLTEACRAYLNVCKDWTNENSDAKITPAGRLKKGRPNKYEKAGLSGLVNIGNTCFMNSILQCLSNTGPLLRYILKEKFIEEMNTNGSTLKGGLLTAYAKLVKDLWKSAGNHPKDTTMLKNQLASFAPVFRGFEQQDSHELLRFLLDALHEELSRVQQKPPYVNFELNPSWDLSTHSREAWKNYISVDNSQIVDIFAGQLKSTLVCCDCGRTSVTFEPFWDLSIPLPSPKSGTEDVTLEQCLESFTKEETLDENEKAFCTNCKSQQKTTKSLSIERFPEVLVIHLKRFKGDGKLRTTVRYPLLGLDLGPYTSSKSTCCSYNLYGVSNHSGSASSGHYIAYCKHPYNSCWSIYDDQNVEPTSVQAVKDAEAYVLFYEMSEGSKSVLL